MFLGLPESGSVYQQTKIVRKTLIPTVMRLLYDFLSLKNDVNIPSKSTKQKNLEKNYFFVDVLKVTDENMQDPDPLVRGMDQRIRIRTDFKPRSRSGSAWNRFV